MSNPSHPPDKRAEMKVQPFLIILGLVSKESQDNMKKTPPPSSLKVKQRNGTEAHPPSQKNYSCTHQSPIFLQKSSLYILFTGSLQKLSKYSLKGSTE
jgi:hypothetical protein